MAALSRGLLGRTTVDGSGQPDVTITAGTPSLLRAINERSVLDLIHRRGPLSRAQVARVSGLSKPTVSLALSGLLESALVREIGRSHGERGPTAVLYELNPTAGWVVGIDVGRQWVRAAIANIAGTLVARRDERAKVSSAASLIGQVGAIAHRLAGEAGVNWSQVTHAALGSPGVFDPARGYVAMAPNLPGWGRHGLVEAVREELGTNVTFENDVNLAALAERAHGLGRNLRDFVFLSIGTGIGMALVIDGQLRRGAHGAAGEIAYLPIGPADPRDPANRRRGAFEEAAAADGIVRQARALGMRPPLSAETIFSAARRGQLTAKKAVDIEAARLALAIATITPVLDPELVILGGGIGRNGDLLLEPIERELRQLMPFRPRVAISALGDDAVLQGALTIALDAARDRVFARSPRNATQRFSERRING
ncbi:MAG: ROK family transcriptional regulator [Chloroflexi bacterium]|nr:MAG: ROK family transcriptional regulator [Chloroflexota bacterium]